MKKYISFIAKIAIIAALLLCSCEGPNIMKSKKFKSYVTRYLVYSGLIVGYDSIDSKLIIVPKEYAGRSYEFDSQGWSEEKFDSLCIVNNDVSFNTRLGYMVSPNWGECSANNFYKVEVFSDKDFDTEHPKGKLLNDILKAYYYSLKPFIDSNYYYQCNDVRRCLPERIEHSKMASELNSTDLHMIPMGPHTTQEYLGLKFTKFPDVKQAHNITVILYENNGEVRTASTLIENWD